VEGQHLAGPDTSADPSTEPQDMPCPLRARLKRQVDIEGDKPRPFPSRSSPTWSTPPQVLPDTRWPRRKDLRHSPPPAGVRQFRWLGRVRANPACEFVGR